MKDYLRLPSTHFGFCTDGHPGQILGIAVLLNGLYSELSCRDTCRVWIAAPSTRHDFIQNRLKHFLPECQLHLLDAKTKDEDRYFVQVGLSEIFHRVDPTDYIVCLDYDHVLLRSLKPFFTDRPSVVVVSSEVRPALFFPVEGFFGQRSDMQTLNTSLIWGRVDRLRAIGEIWAECYCDLAPHIPTRNLVEYAFGLASLRTNSRVVPCSRKIQGNMFNMNADCIVFHYGGDGESSLSLKRELYRKGIACLNQDEAFDAVKEIDRLLKMFILSFGRQEIIKDAEGCARMASNSQLMR